MAGNQQFDTPQEALAHYGVKGMRWGVHKEDDAGGPAISAKKQQKVNDFFDEAAKARALAAEMDEQGIDSPEMRRLYGKAVDRSDRMFAIMYGQSKDKAVRQQIEFNEKRAQYLEKNAEAIQAGKLTSGQKKALIGGLAASAVIGYVGYRAYQDAQSNKATPGDSINSRVFTRRYVESAEQYMGKRIPSYDALDDHDIAIPKGTVFSRLTAYKDEDMEGRLYTTFTEDDNNKYRGIYGAALRQRTGKRELFVSEMKMGESVRSPSHRKRVEIYADLRREIAGDPDTPAFRKYHSDLALHHYNNFARQLVSKSEISDRYFKMVEDRGYNAILDDNDAGQLSDLPMILLRPKSMVTSREFKPLTPKLEKEARKNFKEIRRVNKEGLSVPEEYRSVKIEENRVPQLVHSGQVAVLVPKKPFDTPAEALAALRRNRKEVNHGS